MIELQFDFEHIRKEELILHNHIHHNNGPLLILIYINDLPLATSFFTNLFADDTSFLKSSQHIETLVIDANFELKKAAAWFQANRLTLNVSKTKFMIFRIKNLYFDPENCKLKMRS